MEHIVQFGISIDDDAIKKRVEECLYRDLVKYFTDDAENRLGLSSSYSRENSYRDILSESASNFIEKNRDQIVQIVTKLLVEKLSKSSKFRDAILEKCNETD